MKVLIFSVFLILTSVGYVFAEPVTTKISSQEKIHFVDEQIMIMADISNNQDVQQNFAYITQVKNDNDVVISLSWLTGSLSPRQSFSPHSLGFQMNLEITIFESLFGRVLLI